MLKPGVPHLVTRTKCGKIPQEQIDRFLRGGEYHLGWSSLRTLYSADYPCPSDFELPFTISASAVFDDLKPLTIDNDLFPTDPLDPKDWPENQRLCEEYGFKPFDLAELEKLEPSLSA